MARNEKSEMRSASTENAVRADVENQAKLFLAQRVAPNLRWILMGVLVVVAAIWIVINWQARQRVRMQQGYAAVAAAASVEELREVAVAYYPAAPAEKASFLVGRWLYDQGTYAEAASAFDEFCMQYPESRMIPAARLGEAYALESSGQVEAARQAFTDLAGNSVSAEMVAEAWLGAGRCAMAAGDRETARQCYELAVAAAETGPVRDQAAAALRQLLTGDRAALSTP